MAKEMKTVGELILGRLEQLDGQLKKAPTQGAKDSIMDQQRAITADPRYIPYIEQYVKQHPTGASAGLLAEAKKTHEQAVQAQKNDPPSTGLTSATNKIYELAEHHGKKERGQLMVDEIKGLSARSKEGFGAPLNKAALIHIQADPRYLQYMDEYLEGSSYNEEQKNNYRQRAQKIHESAADHVAKNPENAAGIRGSNRIFAELERKGTGPLVSQDNPVILASAKTPQPPIKIDASKDNTTLSGEDKSTTTPYEIQKGDSLWNIAKEHYGLTNPKDIQMAVDNIARENAMNGVKANHMDIGQEIKLPNSPKMPEGSSPALDWKALDADNGMRNSFKTAATAFKPDTAPAANMPPVIATNDDNPTVSSKDPNPIVPAVDINPVIPQIRANPSFNI